MNKDYPVHYGAMRGALTSLYISYQIPGVKIEDAEAFRKWLAERAESTDAYAVEMAKKFNQKSS